MAEQIWLASQPTIANGGKAILLSTPKGCFLKDTKITVRDKHTGQIKKITIQDLKNDLV